MVARAPSGKFPGVRLESRSDDDRLTEAWAYLTTEVAYLLHLSLSYYFGDDDKDPGWHCHMGGGDGEPELTIAIVD